MCGPSAAQSDLQAQQTDFYRQMQEQDATTFGENQAILTQMKSIYAPILAKGPNQFGFSQGQVDNLNTQASEGVARSFEGAKKALMDQQAGTGGDTYIPSGVNTQQDAALDVAASDEQSKEEQQIQQAGYQQGYNEFSQATSALEGTAAQLNPNGYASNANTAGSDAASTANTIAAQSTSWVAPVLGAVGAVGGAATGSYISKHP